MAGTTVSLRYWPVAPVPPPRTSILVALEPITSTFPLLITPPVVRKCQDPSPGRAGRANLNTIRFALGKLRGVTGRWAAARRRRRAFAHVVRARSHLGLWPQERPGLPRCDPVGRHPG